MKRCWGGGSVSPLAHPPDRPFWGKAQCITGFCWFLVESRCPQAVLALVAPLALAWWCGHGDGTHGWPWSAVGTRSPPAHRPRGLGNPQSDRPPADPAPRGSGCCHPRDGVRDVKAKYGFLIIILLILIMICTVTKRPALMTFTACSLTSLGLRTSARCTKSHF